MVAKFLDHNNRELKNDGGGVLLMAKKKQTDKQTNKTVKLNVIVLLP